MFVAGTAVVFVCGGGAVLGLREGCGCGECEWRGSGGVGGAGVGGVEVGAQVQLG